MRKRTFLSWALFFWMTALAPAQETTAPGEAAGTTPDSLKLPFEFDGPPPPVPPEVVNRDEAGRTTIRAVRLTEPLRIDGRIDDAVYTTVPPASDFIQAEPQAGSPATDRTDVWVLFDDDNLYVSLRCWESRPDRILANEMRRDNPNMYRNDYVDIILDTFYDRRNALQFGITPIGGRTDGQITGERYYNGDWNPVWNAEVGRFEQGWTVEAVIPFKSLRYRPGLAQIWGFNIERFQPWKNEVSFLTRMPPLFSGPAGMQISFAATLVGLEVPAGSKNLEIKPYLVANLTSDLKATPPISNDPGADAGVDVKYGLTQNLTADFTYNTDFAQVESDEQQVNLTRFSLFFPEKREFFLENRGTFEFGGAGTTQSGDTPILFYSRRIGLHEARAVPIVAGGRLTGRLGRYSVGVLNIQSGDEPVSGAEAANFTVLRLTSDVLRRSRVGVLYTGRSVNLDGDGSNEVYGVDGNFAFFNHLFVNTYWARTRTPGMHGDDTSYRALLNYAGDRYGFQLERLAIGDDFNPEVGFVRRDDIRRNFGQIRFSPRSRSIPSIRRFSWVGSIAYTENGAGRLETRDQDLEFGIELQNSDRLLVTYGRNFEFLPDPFPIARGVTLPVGGYDYATLRTTFNFGQHRRIYGNLSVEHGSFFSGRLTAFGISRGRVNLTSQFSFEPSLSLNWVDLAEGAFTTRLVGSRVTYAMSPRLFVSALLQYNSANNVLATNVRLRWEYRPGSELFVVYNEGRDTLGPGFPGLANKALILKLTGLVRF